MKLVKMSLLAATLIASSAFAIDNVKVDGDAKLFYSTWDGENDDLFNKNSAAGQAALGLGVTADLTEGVSAGAHLTALTSLGLYNNLVSNVWEGTPEDEFFFDEAWMAGTYGKTTLKAGRMQLDTPLVFSEQWSIVANTFSAAVLINQDIPDTTLVGAYVGQANDAKSGGGALAGILPNVATGYANVTNGFANALNTNFHSFWGGAYAAGAVNNSWEPLTVQAWYFQAQSALNAYWLQGDLNIIGIDVGLQYTGLNEGANLSDESNSAFAAKVGYGMEGLFSASVAVSQTGDTATALQVGANLSGTVQSKLYTEAWWNYGYITLADTTAVNVTVTTPEELTYVALGAYITQSTTTDGIAAGTDTEMTEVTLEAAKSFGPLDAGLYYILTDANDQNLKDANADSGQSYNTVQAYLTYNF